MKWLLLGIGVLLFSQSGYSFFHRRNDTELIMMKLQEAKILMADEKYDEAINLLKQIVDQYPEEEKTEIALATINHCYQIIGYMNEAFDYYQEVEKKHPDTRVALVAVYYYIPILIQRERYQEAIQKCQQIYDKAPESYWAIGSLFNLSLIHI